MNDAAGRVKHDAKLLGEQHVTVAAVGPALDGSGIDVSVVAPEAGQVEQAAALLKERYGDIVGDVQGVDGKTSDADLFFGGWRFNDFAPWYGGDRIRSSAGGCSTGFAAVQNGAPAMLTAAHCGGVGTASNGPRSNNTFSFMGNSVYSNAATDVAAIGVTSASNYINVGSALSPTQLYVGSWGSPVVGQYLCQSGSYTGETCGLRVVDTGQSVCQSWFLWWCTSWQGPLADVHQLGRLRQLRGRSRRQRRAGLPAHRLFGHRHRPRPRGADAEREGRLPGVLPGHDVVPVARGLEPALLLRLLVRPHAGLLVTIVGGRPADGPPPQPRAASSSSSAASRSAASASASGSVPRRR